MDDESGNELAKGCRLGGRQALQGGSTIAGIGDGALARVSPRVVPGRHLQVDQPPP